MSRILVEHYNREIHGDHDDCDYVVSYTMGIDNDLKEEAHRIADLLSVCDYYQMPNGNFVQLFCCHS